MKKYLIIFLLLIQLAIQAQTLPTVYQDNFDNNASGWKLSNNAIDQSQIQAGKLSWKHNDNIGNSISNYLNLLNTKADFSTEAVFDVKKAGSEYGLMIGGIDQENGLYFTVKNLQFRIFEFKNGKSNLLKDYTTSFKIKPLSNVLRVVKKGPAFVFIINEHELHSLPSINLPGKAFGFALWNNAAVDIDAFIVKGTAIKINLAPGLRYSNPEENLSSGVNTSSGELTPVVTADGKGLYFTRTYYPQNLGGASDYQDIYFSSFENGKLAKAINIGKPVNNDGPNAISAVSPDGNTMLLMNTYDNKGGAQAMGLSFAQKINEGWSNPKTLQIQNFYNKSTFNEYHLSSDNKVLLLALQRDDTYGIRDLYVSFLKEDGSWSAPKNLGANVNTPGTELSPFLASDGVSLYFSSTGHPGYGKSDIFVSRRLDDTWTKWSTPQNIGLPVNSKGIDMYYTLPASGEYAYFVSDEKTPGNTDIFRIKLPSAVKPNPVVLIYGKVLNSKTGLPISTGITYRDMESDKEAGIATSNAVDGHYQITLPYNKSYTFFAEKEGFYSVRDSISVPNIKEYREIERNIYLTPLEVGQNIALNNIFFVRSQPTLLPSSFPELNKLAKTLMDNPTIEIELAGHTDNVGIAEKNVILSEQRVETVKKYLVEKGVAEERISGQGYGGAQPIADNSAEVTRRLNRRVEFKILKF